MLQLSAVIFDWDGTLVDSMEGIRASANHTFNQMRQRGFEVDVGHGEKGYGQWTNQETQLRFPGTAVSFFHDTFGAFGESVSAMALEIFHKKLAEVHLNNIEELAGARETLVLLHNKGVPIAIVSNKDEGLLQEEVTHLFGADIPGLTVKGAAAGKRGKPYPDPIFDALQAMNISAATSIWMVGDSVSDVKAGVKSGSYPVLFSAVNLETVTGLRNDPEHKSVVNGKDVGYAEDHQSLQKLISGAEIVLNRPYHQENNPRLCWKPQTPRQPKP